MGGWKLEAFKMAIYMSFPVGAFLIFNSPQFYEKAIYEYRKEMDQFLSKDNIIEEYSKKFQKERLEKQIEAMKNNK